MSSLWIDISLCWEIINNSFKKINEYRAIWIGLCKQPVLCSVIIAVNLNPKDAYFSRRNTWSCPSQKNVFPPDLITISLWGGMEEAGLSPVRVVLGLSVAQWGTCRALPEYFTVNIPVINIFPTSFTLYLHQTLRLLFPILKYNSKNNLCFFTMRRGRMLLA